MRSECFDFPGGGGHRLAARLDLPDGAPRAHALFAHCFTCGKDVNAAARLAAALAAEGVATLRFDFTGFGGSDGEFANTGFVSNTADLLAAADRMRAAGRAPSFHRLVDAVLRSQLRHRPARPQRLPRLELRHVPRPLARRPGPSLSQADRDQPPVRIPGITSRRLDDSLAATSAILRPWYRDPAKSLSEGCRDPLPPAIVVAP